MSEHGVVAVNESGDAPPQPLLKVEPVRRLTDAKSGTWTQLDIEIPGKDAEDKMDDRVGHTLISVPKRGMALMMGGGNHYGDIDQVWKLEVKEDGGVRCSLQEELTTAFPGRYEFFCGVNEQNDQIWIFGGADLAAPRNDVCVIDLESGSILNPFAGTSEGSHDDSNVPVARTQGTNSCVMKIKGEEYLAVFGGGMQCEKAVPDGNLYLYKLSDGTWRRVEVAGSTPNPVQGHGLVAIGTTVFLHGGMNEFKLSSDSYLIDLSVEKPAWVKVPDCGFKPIERAAYGIAAIGNDVIICGGLGDEGAMADLWKFNIESKQWSVLNTGEDVAITPRLDFAMTTLTYPINGQPKTYILVHGGMNTYGNLFKDFWIYPLDL